RPCAPPTRIVLAATRAPLPSARLQPAHVLPHLPLPHPPEHRPSAVRADRSRRLVRREESRLRAYVRQRPHFSRDVDVPQQAAGTDLLGAPPVLAVDANVDVDHLRDVVVVAAMNLTTLDSLPIHH